MGVNLNIRVDGVSYGILTGLPVKSFSGGVATGSPSTYEPYSKGTSTLSWDSVTGCLINALPQSNTAAPFFISATITDAENTLTFDYTPSLTSGTYAEALTDYNITTPLLTSICPKSGNQFFVGGYGVVYQLSSISDASPATQFHQGTVTAMTYTGGQLYTGDESGAIHKFDMTNGITASLPVADCVNGITSDSTYLYVVGNYKLYRVNIHTFTVSDSIPLGSKLLRSICQNGTTLYVGSSLCYYTVDTLSFNPVGSYGFFSIDSSTLNSLAVTDNVNSALGMTCDNNGNLLITDRGGVVILSPGTGSIVSALIATIEPVCACAYVNSQPYFLSYTGTIRSYSTDLVETMYTTLAQTNTASFNQTARLGEYITIPNSDGTMMYRCGVYWDGVTTLSLIDIYLNIDRTPTDINLIPTYGLTNTVLHTSATPNHILGISRTTTNTTWGSFPLYYRGVTSELPSSNSRGDCYLVSSAFDGNNIGDVLIYDTSFVNAGNFYSCLGYCDLIPVPNTLLSESNLYLLALSMDFASCCLQYKGSLDITITSGFESISTSSSGLPSSPSNGDWYSLGTVTYVEWDNAAIYPAWIQSSDILLYQTSVYGLGWSVFQPGQQLRTSCITRSNSYTIYDPKIAYTRNSAKTFEPGLELNVVHTDGTVIPSSTSISGGDASYSIAKFPMVQLINSLQASGRIWNACNYLIVGETDYFRGPEPNYTNPFYKDRFSGFYGTQYPYKYPTIQSLVGTSSDSLFINGHFQNGLYDDLSQNFDTKAIQNTWKTSKLCHDLRSIVNGSNVNGYNSNWISGSVASRKGGHYQPAGGAIYSSGYDYSYTAIDTTNNYIYVSSFLNSTVDCINLSTNAIDYTFTISNPTGLAINSTGTTLYVSQGNTNSILVYTLAITKSSGVITNIAASLSNTLTSSLLKDPRGLYLDSSNVLWIANWFAGGIVQYSNNSFTQSSLVLSNSYITNVYAGSSICNSDNKGMSGQDDPYFNSLSYSGITVGGEFSEIPYAMSAIAGTYGSTSYTLASSYLLNTVFINGTGYTLNKPCGISVNGKYAYIACSGYLAVCDLTATTLSFTKIPLGGYYSSDSGLTFSRDITTYDMQNPRRNVLNYWGGQCTDGGTLVNSPYLYTENTQPPTLNYPTTLGIQPSELTSSGFVLEYSVYPILSDIQNTYIFVYVNGIGVYNLIVIRNDFNDTSNTTFESYSLPIQPLKGEPVIGWYTVSNLTLVYPTSKDILRVYQTSDYTTWNLNCWSDNTGISWKTGTVGLI
jgi:hypothetical protein